MLAQHPRAERLAEQNASAGDEPTGRGEAAMSRDEARPRDAVAVEENAQSAGALEDRAVADFGEPETLVLMMDVRQRKSRLRAPLRNDLGGRRAGSVVRDQHLEIPIALAREAAQHRIER